MRSRVQIKGHPLHPILVGFPITFFISTFLFDLAGWWREETSFRVTAKYLHVLGMFTAMAAAIPGLIDYLSVVPPKSSARKRGAQHGILNSVALLLFIGIWWYKKEMADPLIFLATEFIAVAMMGFSGWLGGTLVHRNKIGIDHRYANAGKWTEKKLNESRNPIEVGDAAELLSVNQMMILHVGNKRVVLGRTEAAYVAFDDFCSHRGRSLADGAMICGVVQCPWHGSQFDCKTGAVTAGPATKAIDVFQASEKDGKVYVTISPGVS